MSTALIGLFVGFALAGCGLVLEYDPGGPDGGDGRDAARLRDDGGRVRDGAQREDGAVQIDASWSDVDSGVITVEGGTMSDGGLRPADAIISPVDAGSGLRAFGDPCVPGEDATCASGRCVTFPWPPWCWYTGCTEACVDDGDCDALLAPFGFRPGDGHCNAGLCDLAVVMLGMEYCE